MEGGQAKVDVHIWFKLSVFKFNFSNTVRLRIMTQESINVHCNWWITYFSVHCISDQKVRLRTVVVRSVQKVYFSPKILGKNTLVRGVQNCVSDQIQWSEISKTFDHHCSLKMLWKIIIWHLDLELDLEQTGAWNVDKLPFWPKCVLSDKSTKIGRGRFVIVCFELIRCGAMPMAMPMATVVSGGLAHVQVRPIAETF